MHTEASAVPPECHGARASTRLTQERAAAAAEPVRVSQSDQSGGGGSTATQVSRGL